MKKIGLILIALVVALGAMGVGYALWDKELYIYGTVNTGEVNACFTEAFTDDDGVVNNPDMDAGDDGGGTLLDMWGPDSSDDPSEFGPNPARYDKDVGRCYVRVGGGDCQQELYFTLENGYPCYSNSAWYALTNTGTVPVKIFDWYWEPVDFDNQGQLTVEFTGLRIGDQIDPGETRWGDIHVHVNQAAAEQATYNFRALIWLGQWNEFDMYVP